MKLRATVYPNNEVRVALYPERLPVDYFKSASTTTQQILLTNQENQGTPTLIRDTSSEIERNRALDIKSKDDTRVRPRRWSLSRNGRNQILRAGACFDKGLETERLLLTGTLPGSTIASFKALAQNSTVITKRLTNWITRHEPQCNWMYAWEFQGRGALHIHLVVECQIEASAYFKAHFKDEWIKLLRDVSRESKTDLFAKTANYSHNPQRTQADVTVCDREPSRYISKYISKKATNSKGFSRFPPKTWYQISRNLLRRLRMRTVIYEAEGLTYSQSRAIEENTLSHVAQHAIGGVRRFDGAVYAWSAYFYGDGLNLTEIYKGLGEKDMCLLSTQQMANLARATMKDYPGGSCYMRAATHPKTFALMEARMLSETELLLYIESVTRTLSESIESEWNKHKAAHYLVSVNNWWKSKYSYDCVQPAVITFCNNICKEYLTG